MSLRRRVKDLFSPKKIHLGGVEARLDLIEARLDLLGQRGQAVYLGGNRVLTRTAAGHLVFSFLLEANDRLFTPALVAGGQFEPPVTNFFLREVRKDSHCLDVGANFGYYACLMAYLADQGRTIAVEADRHVFELARDNLMINGLVTGSAVHLAASDRDGELTLNRRSTRSGNTSIISMGEAFTDYMGEAPEERFTVPTAPIDSLLDRMDGRVDLMKIDVEGAEPLVLRGARQTISANPQLQIMMEWSPGQIQAGGTDLRSFCEDIASMGLRVFDLDGDRQVQLSVDQLVETPYRSGIVLRR